MANLKYSLNFNGYYTYISRGSVINSSGIYCVYSGTDMSENTVSLDKLIYIGESEDVRARLQNHEKLDDWKKYLRLGQSLYFTSAKVDSYYRERIEAALIYKHKPPVNTEYKYSFPYDTTSIVTSGANYALEVSFTVYKTNSYAI